MKHLLRIFFFALITLTGAPAQESAAQAPGAKSGVQAPDGYVLTAAYPNPFRASTSFNLTVRQPQNVLVQVFNMLGQPVRDLFSGPMQAGETRTFTFDADGLPSGIYLYRVQGEHFMASRQVMLVK